MEWILIVLVLIVDQVTKYGIQSSVELHGSIEIIPHFFYITYVRNTGAAWSILEGQQIFLSVLAAVVIGVLLRVLIRGKGQSKLYRIAISLMIGGAGGNLIDRVLFGSVRDFLDFYPFGYNFPVFNVADSALCIGVGLLIIDTLINEHGEQKGKHGTAEI